ncbi:MAG TPA: FKBP-type peptidyl-prolyl cis-trans isomerase [Cyclobacteriaceae bacterium]|nr:FKBP-type peptidyl-prolyl cis-trans isomerase [Cyclobacteriaceae bacterium]
MRSSRLLMFGVFVLSLSLTGCMTNDPVAEDPGERLKLDVGVIDTYLEGNNISAIKESSGVRYHIDAIGTGLPPRTDQQIRFVYQGRLFNGNIFDEGGTAVGPLSDYIPGWQLALQMWPAGTRGTIYVPSPLGYGNQTVGTIPPNSILIFDVQLKEVVLTAQEKARFASDLQVIDEHLSKNKITAVKDTTGVRYVLTAPGTGTPPTWYQKVRFSYSSKILESGQEFFTGTAAPKDDFESRMIDYLHGIKIGLSKIGVGGKITVYVPSGLAFGPFDNSTGNIQVPANSNIIYTIELLEIVP